MALLIKTVQNSTDSQSTTVDVYSGRRNIWFKNEATSRIGFSHKTPSPNNLQKTKYTLLLTQSLQYAKVGAKLDEDGEE